MTWRSPRKRQGARRPHRRLWGRRASPRSCVGLPVHLLHGGCSTESRNNIGQTPKDLALRMEYNEIVEALEVVEERLARLEAKKKREREKAHPRAKRK